ncbi:MAG: DNA (cytosine-5-)-methyltransferase [Candidatus Helarchaeota archaeon]
MIETKICKLKRTLGNYLYSSDPYFFKESSINNVCDEILSNYFAYILYIKDQNKKTEEDFFKFLKNRGNLKSTILDFLKKNTIIVKWLFSTDFYNEILNPYKLAETYEEMKSYTISVINEKISIIRNLDYRKSKGLYFTPKEIVEFIVKNSLDIKSYIIEKLIDKGNGEQALKIFLDLKVADIACGTGSFLYEIINELKKIRRKIIHKIGMNALEKLDEGKIIVNENIFIDYILNKVIFGVDIDKNSVLLCAYSLMQFNNFDEKKTSIYEKNIKIGNSLIGFINNNKLVYNFPPIFKKIFNWSEEFPEVFNRKNPGFDIIVMNPPYGKVRLESNKGYHKNVVINEEDKMSMKKLAEYFRNSGLYKSSLYGVLNFYKLMIERSFYLLRKGGILGFIAPSTLLCDKSTANLRKYLFNNMNTKIIVEIPENSCFFKDVSQSFCIISSINAGKTKYIKFKGNIKNIYDLNSDKYININIDFIRKKFPDMLYIPITNDIGFKIFNKLHRFDKLGNFKFIKNSRGEVDLSKFSNIISFDTSQKRLIRGHNIERYYINNDITTKPCFINEEKLKIQLKNSPKLDDITKIRLVCKQIANQNKEKRLEFAIVPPGTILGNSCNYIIIKNDVEQLILNYLLGLLNSSLIEWRFRITSTNNHINNYEINDLPLIIPQKGDAKWKIVEEIAHYAKLAEKLSDQRDLLENKIDYLVFKLFGLDIKEVEYILSETKKSHEDLFQIKEQIRGYIMDEGIYNHITAPLSDLEMRMIRNIPEGGNWKDIPLDCESKRVQQIRRTGGRTTYYGRLRWDKPAYTISTYFNRSGNGCFIHPEQDRLISLREGARLQSFPDSFIFYGPKTSIYRQIGNAVPPLMAKALGDLIKPKKFVSLFCGAGGFSLGMEWSGGKCELAIDSDKYCCKTFKKNHNINDNQVLNEDIKKIDLENTFSVLNHIDIVIGGPPCQGFSTAGKCLLDDPRNELVKYFIKCVEIIQPRYFIMENVKGILFFKKGQLVNEIYKEITKINYNMQHKILLAADFGVPQLRERVFFIGTRNKEPIYFPKPIFSKYGISGPKYITVKEAIGDLPPIMAGGGSMDKIPYLSEPKSDYQRLMRGMISVEEFYNRKINLTNNKIKKSAKISYMPLDKYF